MNGKKLEKLAHLFKALSDPHRLEMISRICQCSSKGKEVNVGDLGKCCDIDLSVVSRHLSKLKSAGVLRARKSGKEVFYEMNGKEVADSLRALADYIENMNCC